MTDILERPEGLELGGDLRRVSIMLSDIRGFTSLSENLAPAQVVTMLNRYLGAMTDIIMAHHGTIDEFIGDAILAVFGAPQRRDDDADRAVRASIAMMRSSGCVDFSFCSRCLTRPRTSARCALKKAPVREM